ncbi:MAG: peptidylprolyl isomerase [Bacteroidales bacterium]
MDYKDKKASAKVRLVGARYSTINDSLVTVTDADFKKYYEDYKQNYKQEATRDIDYVVFEVKPSIKDRKEIRQQAFAIFEDFKKADNVPLFVNGESDTRYDSTFYKEGQLPVRIDSLMFNSEVGTFVDPYIENDAWHMAKLVDVQFRPDSMKASHLLISYAGAAGAGQDVTRIKVDAKAFADSLLGVIKAEPGKLEVLSKLYSNDPSAETNSGDLGWFADGSMVYPFNNAVLNGKEGEITFAETMFGYHIIKITGKQEPTKKVRVAMIDVAITPSQETYQEVFAQASEFQGKATSLEAFDTLATHFGISKKSAPNLTAMSNRIAGIDYPRGIVQWSFIEGIGAGSVSTVFTMEDNYIVAAVTKVKEEGIPPLADLKEVLEPLIRKDLKGDVMIEKMSAAANDSKNLVEIAAKLDSKVDTLENVTFNMRNVAGYGNEPDVLAKIFTMNTGVISKPVKGSNAAFFVIVDEVTPINEEDDFRIYEKQLISGFTAKVNNNSYITILQSEADVVDNRVKFF